MEKIISTIKPVLFILFMVLFGLALFSIFSTGDDNGIRKAIDGTKIEWELLLTDLDEGDDSVPGIVQIKVNNVEVKDSMYYIDFVKIFNEHSKLISDDKKNGYSKVYVNFDKVGFIQMSYTRTKYNGKETTFYIKTSAIEELLKENVLVKDDN